MLRLISKTNRSLLWRSRRSPNIQRQCLRCIHQNAPLRSAKPPTPASVTEATGDDTSAGQNTPASDTLTKAKSKRTTARKKPRAPKIKDPQATSSQKDEGDPDPVKLVTKPARKAKSKKDASGSSKSQRTVKKAKNSAPDPGNVSTKPDDAIADLPVADVLRTRYGRGRRRNPLGDTRRVHVVGEGLCDDILERMRPSLAKHAGCDILDINPGAGVFSSKLHDFLKPRTHILMEPDYKLYEPFLQPLLDDKASKYVLYEKSGIVWSHLEKVLSKEHLPFQEPLTKDDPRLDKPNDTLLVVANLSYHPKKSFRGFSSLTMLVLHQLMAAVRAHSLFQKYGLVRMLIWVTDEERLISLPRHAAIRKKAAIEAEISCGKIFEIASSTRQTGYFCRGDDIEAEQARLAMKRMEESGITTPSNRLSVPQEYLLKQAHEEGELAGSLNSNKKGRRYWKELEDLEKQFATGQLSKFSDGLNTTNTDRSTSSRELTPEFLRLRGLRYRRVVDGRRTDIVASLVAKHAEIIDLQCQIHRGESSDVELLRKELEQLTKQLKDTLAAIPGDQTRQLALSSIDNQRFVMQDPPALLYDRREFEPLRVYPGEFFPRHELALLDFQPQGIWPVLRENYPANHDVFEYIIATMHMFPNQSIRDGLKSLWPGAYEWILQECPSLTDPTRGGDQDLDMFPVRCMNSGMFKEILEAWFRWPWRPTRFELLSRLGAYSGDSGDGGDGGDGDLHQIGSDAEGI
ncbi:uncharacterized protein BP5553_09098 [Venustampulla echinocandica]|uniref:rRNA adenine N(6)-methyltransferase n=1 Tax=Venustampulla echinocandica TaxID=2656787 RepID=A0A370TDX1_9HELO|nr:uncharacterized protein BP5553_09098 [Venustampulla echinocandica]RDL32642.1 hypothetical protein BP5553_09098 [Venustampulla echinocandica]